MFGDDADRQAGWAQPGVLSAREGIGQRAVGSRTHPCCRPELQGAVL